MSLCLDEKLFSFILGIHCCFFYCCILGTDLELLTVSPHLHTSQSLKVCCTQETWASVRIYVTLTCYIVRAR